MVNGIGGGVQVWTGLESVGATRPGSNPVGGANRIGETGGAGGTNFSEALTSAVQSVEQSQAAADESVYKVATGQDADLHGMMIALEEANISLRAMASVRDKVVEAYQAIWNMPV